MKLNKTILACLAATCLYTGTVTASVPPAGRRQLHVYHRPPLQTYHVRHHPHAYPSRHGRRRHERRNNGHAHPTHRSLAHPRLAPPPPLPALPPALIPVAPAAPQRDMTSTWQPYSYP